MSYVLEALKRADAQRERGAVPDLHARPSEVTAGENPLPRAGVAGWWIAAGLAVGLGAPLAWYLGTRQAADDTARQGTPPASVPLPPPTRATAVLPLQPPAQPEPLPPSRAQPLPSQPAPAAAPPPVPAARLARTPAAPPPVAAPMPKAAVAPAPKAPPPATAQMAGAPTAAATPTTAPIAPSGPSALPATAAPSSPSAERRIVPVRELPEAVRRELPPLTLGGSVYSESPGQRLLIVNGQVVHEGQTLAAGLTLEQIRPKGAVFQYKSHRFELTF